MPTIWAGPGGPGEISLHPVCKVSLPTSSSQTMGAHQCSANTPGSSQRCPQALSHPPSGALVLWAATLSLLTAYCSQVKCTSRWVNFGLYLLVHQLRFLSEQQLFLMDQFEPFHHEGILRLVCKGDKGQDFFRSYTSSVSLAQMHSHLRESLGYLYESQSALEKTAHLWFSGYKGKGADHSLQIHKRCSWIRC